MDVAIRISSYIDVLYTVVSEASKYLVWEVHYGDDWVKEVTRIEKSITSLYKQKDSCSELEMHFSFAAGQLLKKMLLYYIQANFVDMELNTMKSITQFILLIDDRIEEELAAIFVEFAPGVKAWQKI